MSCTRFRSIAILLILVALIACASAQPGDGTEGFNDMDFSFLASMGEQFSGVMAHNQFAQMTTPPMVGSGPPRDPPRSHPRPQRHPAAAPIDDHFGCVSPWGMELPDNLGLGIQNIQDPMRMRRSFNSAGQTTVPVQGQLGRYTPPLGQGQMPSMRRAGSMPLTNTPQPMSVPMPPADFGAIGTPVNSGYPNQRFVQQLPMQQTWPLGTPPMQNACVDQYAMQTYPPSMLPTMPNPNIPHYASQPAPASVPEILSFDVTSNYNYQQGISPNNGVDMRGWIGRAPTTGDRAVPRLTTDHLMDNNRLLPPESTSANISPTSASSTGSSGGRSRRLWQGNLNCHWCSASFGTQGDLTHHLRSHAPYMSRQHVCRHCEKRFQYRKDLARHLPKHDANRKKYYCPISNCKYFEKGFGRQDHLDRHMGSQHRLAEMQREDTPLRGRTPSQ